VFVAIGCNFFNKAGKNYLADRYRNAQLGSYAAAKPASNYWEPFAWCFWLLWFGTRDSSALWVGAVRNMHVKFTAFAFHGFMQSMEA
jgi:hypothetical protein